MKTLEKQSYSLGIISSHGGDRARSCGVNLVWPLLPLTAGKELMVMAPGVVGFPLLDKVASKSICSPVFPLTYCLSHYGFFGNHKLFSKSTTVLLCILGQVVKPV